MWVMNAMYLKKMGPLVLAAAVFLSCNEHASIEVHVDSVGRQKAHDVIDSAGAGLRKVGEKAKELGGRAKDRLDHLAADSTHK